ncbi:MAG: OmpA family protein [Alphaproteobacteria bacterium]|nr:OmpA family protein [Alphaproteobacteria bacterium]
MKSSLGFARSGWLGGIVLATLGAATAAAQGLPLTAFEAIPATVTTAPGDGSLLIRVAGEADAEKKRIEEEEASFLKLVEDQRKADAEAAKAKAEAKKAAEAEAARKAAEADQKRIAEEEASFLNPVEAQRKADAEAAKAKAEAKKAAEAEAARKAAEADQKRIAEEEASFLKLVEDQRKADAEAAKAKKAAAPAIDRKAEVAACQTRIQQIGSESAIQFGYNSAALSGSAGKSMLDELVKVIGECKGDPVIIVEGHTDSRGTKQGNELLSKERAETVADYLRSKGVPAERISSEGLGSAKPIASNDTREGRARNRRIEFRVE